MTEAEPSPDIRRLPALLRAVLIVALFAILGPPIGGLIAWLIMGAASLRSPLPFILGSYGEGLLLAAGAGLYVAAAWWLFGRTSWIAPVLGAILANLVFHGVTMSAEPPPDAGAVLRVAEVFLLPSIVAAVVCWLVSRKLLL